MDAARPAYSLIDTATTRSFVDAMASAAMGVSVVTTHGASGTLGLAVSAWSSVSAEPPLVLICINRKNLIAEAISHNGRFAINVLAETQVDVARVFAGRSPDGRAYDFSMANWQTSREGDMVLADASAAFCCKVESASDAGTHRIFIGRAEHVATANLPPLLYHNRAFGRFEPLP